MKKSLIFVVVGAILVVGGILFSAQKAETYSLSPTGLLVYRDSLTPEYAITDLADGSKKIVFPSRGWDIYSLYAIPKGKPPYPVFIVLPGGNVEKEMEHMNIAKDLRGLGFATLTIDQRGIRETGGPFPPFEEQIRDYANKNEPIYHKMVSDALHAMNVLKTLPDIDKESIYIAGVSMGGRIAIIAAAQDISIKGVLAVSTGGYGMPSGIPGDAKAFFDSIDPDRYVSIVKVPFVMIHGRNDTVVPLSAAERTFSLANEPKKLFISEEAGHGYYSSTEKGLLNQATIFLKEAKN